MDDDQDGVAHDPAGAGDDAFQRARFPIDLGLPPADGPLFKQAATAIRQEYRSCSRWKKLLCRKVSLFSERGRGTVWIVDVGRSVEFDWTWEGAVAFRPLSLDDNAAFEKYSHEDSAFEDSLVWEGEVLEVDERNGCLFVSLDHHEATPTPGPFFVRPFEFLSVLDSVFNDVNFRELQSLLPPRLAATQGGVHPKITALADIGLPHLRQWWQHSWNVLWGPPGTGKTWTTGQQVAAALNDPTERVLVVSTTNRATDAAALSIGNAARGQFATELKEGRLLRIGKGASIGSFANSDLESMLMGAESALLREADDLTHQLRLIETWEEKALTRKKLGELRSAGSDHKRNFVDPQVRVVVATAFKATCLLNDDMVNKLIESGHAPFTTIFIDEAGLLSRTAIAALSLLAARRVVLVGDSKQLAPISRISRIVTTQQQQWLASSGLSHLDDPKVTPGGVHVLLEQHRMHPDVCQIVSDFQYGGLLTTDAATQHRTSNLAPWLAEYSRAVWYVLDEEGVTLDQIRAERGPGNKSWMRRITPHILEKLLADSSLRQANGLFISPYKAQAQAIAQWLAAHELKRWDASTVHSQQGSEADIVVFDTVNAGSYSWPFDEWKRLVNVALSRAREAIIVLASRAEMDEPYLSPLLRRLTPSRLIKDGDSARWVKVIPTPLSGRVENVPHVLESRATYELPLQFKGSLGGQIQQRKCLKPVLSQEQQRLTGLSLDGKPRLVRGVAGSGKSIVLCNWLARTVKRLQPKSGDCIWAVYANRSLHRLLQESVESSWESLWKGQLFERPEFPWQQVALLHVKDVLSSLLPIASLSIDDFEFDYDRAANEFLSRQDAVDLLPRCTAMFIDEAQDMGPSTLKLLLSVCQRTDASDPNSCSAHIFYDNAQNIYGRKTPVWSEFGLDMRGRSTIMRESFRSTLPITELAINVQHRLTPTGRRKDQEELLTLGLIEKCQREGEDWLRVRFNQIDGPKPLFRMCESRSAEFDAIAADLSQLIQREGISARDICVVYNGKNALQMIETKLGPKMKEIGVDLSVQTNRAFERRDNTLVVTTSHSYKGYESEVVVIPCADQFVTGDGQILANNLYVAMTRARSLLAIYSARGDSPASRQICSTIAACVKIQRSVPMVESEPPE